MAIESDPRTLRDGGTVRHLQGYTIKGLTQPTQYGYVIFGDLGADCRGSRAERIGLLTPVRDVKMNGAPSSQHEGVCELRTAVRDEVSTRR